MSRLYVHIGLQKTGTSYLQSICWQSVEALAAQGLDMVPGSKRETFYLMLDVRGRFNPEFDAPEVGRSLERLPSLLAAAPGSRALITEESLATADDAQIARFLAATAGREVHILVTVRDLGRQIPSAWQQSLQAGGSTPYRAYLEKLQATEAEGGHRIWRQKDVADVLARWSRHVPAARVHVVTVPPSGSRPTALLERFCEVLEVDPATLDTEVARDNAGLRHVSAEVLRRVNARLSPLDRRRDVYGDIGKRYFAVQVLGKDGGRRIQVPRSYETWVREVSARHIAFIRDGGFPVTGDLADLEPVAEAFTDERIRPTEREIALAEADALAAVLSDRMARHRRRRAAERERGGRLRRAWTVLRGGS